MKRILALGLVALLMAGCSSSEEKPETPPSETSGEISGEMGGDLGGGEGGDDAALPEDAPAAQGPSLFDRVGGKAKLDEFANDFVDTLAKDTRIVSNANVAKAMKKADLARFKSQLSDHLCQLAGGPCQYGGKPMKDAHKGMKITKDEWRAMGSIFIRSLKKVGVQKKERVELANLVVGKDKKEIVDQ